MTSAVVFALILVVPNKVITSGTTMILMTFPLVPTLRSRIPAPITPNRDFALPLSLTYTYVQMIFLTTLLIHVPLLRSDGTRE